MTALDAIWCGDIECEEEEGTYSFITAPRTKFLLFQLSFMCLLGKSSNCALQLCFCSSHVVFFSPLLLFT